MQSKQIACAVRAQERENLALADVERYVVDRCQVPVTLGQIFYFDCVLNFCRHGSTFCYGSMYREYPSSPLSSLPIKMIMESYIFT